MYKIIKCMSIIYLYVCIILQINITLVYNMYTYGA